jgi:CheY-like chemotaxis protein
MKQKLNCVLLIDDDESTTFLSSIFIEEADCAKNIQIADSAQKALNYLKRSDEPAAENSNSTYPELIFLDINMPAMDGWEFLAKYNEMEQEQDRTVLVMLTTSLNPEDRIRAESIPQIAAFENKPLTPEVIDRILNKHFSNLVLS